MNRDVSLKFQTIVQEEAALDHDRAPLRCTVFAGFSEHPDFRLG
ncbi:hypothetical protein [Streptomyces silvensis]|nr:hypothetical protein [Streptomyces silvensis]